MRQIILICSCHGQDKKAESAFKLLFPDKPLPEIIRGRDRIYKFAMEIGNEHIKAISKLSGRYAYYIELNGDKIISEYNLTTGEKIA